MPYYDDEIVIGAVTSVFDSSNFGPDCNVPYGFMSASIGGGNYLPPSVGGFGGGPSVGLWHQYGEIPGSLQKTVTLEIADVPRDQFFNSSVTSSLADLVGMPKQKKGIGTLAQTKIIREAVVAIPFKVNPINSEREFYELDYSRRNRDR